MVMLNKNVCIFSDSQEWTLLFQAHVLPSHGNYLVMPYMPPSKASYPLPRGLFAAITRGGVEWGYQT